MYKQTSDSGDYLKRVGSHATKPRASGRIDDIPEWAAEPEEYYNLLRDQYLGVIDQLQTTQKNLAEINEKLRRNLPFKEFEHLRQAKERLGPKIAILESEVQNYRPLVRALGEKSWTSVFYFVATKLLKPEDLHVINDEVHALLKRQKFEIQKGRGEWSDGRHEGRTLADNRRERRVRFRKYRDKRNVLVHSDEATPDRPSGAS